MISPEELQILRNKLDVLSRKKEEMQTLIQAREELAKTLPERRQKIERLRRDNDALEQRQMEELLEATALLKSLRNPDSSKRGKKDQQLPKLEETLADLKSKYAKTVRLYDDLIKIDYANGRQLEPIRQEMKDLRARFEKLENYRGKLPRDAPSISLNIEDLEDQLVNCRHFLERSRTEIPRLREKLDKKVGKNQMQTLELRRLDSEKSGLTHQTVECRIDFWIS
jgi:chromosome segregation ATPase